MQQVYHEWQFLQAELGLELELLQQEYSPHLWLLLEIIHTLIQLDHPHVQRLIQLQFR